MAAIVTAEVNKRVLYREFRDGRKRVPERVFKTLKRWAQRCVPNADQLIYGHRYHPESGVMDYYVYVEGPRQ